MKLHHLFSRRVLFLLFALTALHCPPALAWGWEGHKLVCALAELQLSPAAKTMVDELLEDGATLKGGKVDFAHACLWADDVKFSTRKDTYEHHFLNVPDDVSRIDLSRDCGSLSCILVGTQRALTYLAREPQGSRERERRAAALRYLGHYVGDLHQPLHVGNASDWGGNKIKVEWFGKSTNLHALWDYGMLETAGIKHPDSLRYLSDVRPRTKPDPVLLNWLQESLTLARTNAYVDADGKEIRSGDKLGKAYLDINKHVAIERLLIGAARLADLLNRIAAGEEISAFTLRSGDPG